MLFNSFEFLFFFLPVCLLVFWRLSRSGYGSAAISALFLLSIFFYCWWDFRNAPLIIGSIIFNFFAGQALARSRSFSLLWFSIGSNLALIGYYKYQGFFSAVVLGLDIYGQSFFNAALPLGISFFTFQQIAYLVSCRSDGTAETNFWRYGLFVSFFPQLIAGPIVRHAVLLPQIDQAYRNGRREAPRVVAGLCFLSIGLFKKTVIADSLSPIASNVFDQLGTGSGPQFFEAWVAAFAYTFQIYFDFSAYSDMAIGLGLLFGISLPVNFFSPYAARTPAEFWRRWHITLSDFLRDYVYIPLGGNRLGKMRHAFNVIFTMFVGGLWHGAGLNFLAWGLVHGVLIWLSRVLRLPNSDRVAIQKIRDAAGLSYTLLAITLAWVLFRAADFSSAVEMYHALFGGNAIMLPSPFSSLIGADGGQSIFIVASGGDRWIGQNHWSVILALGGLALWCIYLPNTAQLLGYVPERFAASEKATWGVTLDRPWVGVAAGAIFVIAVLHISRDAEFIYFLF